MRRCWIGWLLAAWLCLLASAAAPAHAASVPSYQVWAVRYATLPNFPLRALVHGPDVPNQRMDLACIFWVLRGGGHTILFDTGFYRRQFLDQWKPPGFIKPSDAIAPLGLKPEVVTDVIISHAHWDHLDGLDLFPRAQVWIQADEFHYYSDPAQQGSRTGVIPADIAALDAAQAAGRLHLIAGDSQTVLPGIVAYTGGRHTYAAQYIGVHTRKGTVILASDNVYLYMNLDRHLPIGEVFGRDYAANLAAQDRMRRLASHPDLVIPGHDALEFSKFPHPGHGIARIA